MESTLGPSGALVARKRKTIQSVGWRWKMRNTLRWGFLWGWLCNLLAIWFSRLTGIRTIRAQLRAIKRLADGTLVDYGIIGYREVTDAGVAFLPAFRAFVPVVAHLARQLLDLRRQLAESVRDFRGAFLLRLVHFESSYPPSQPESRPVRQRSIMTQISEHVVAEPNPNQ